jgi:hypothetical protein
MIKLLYKEKSAFQMDKFYKEFLGITNLLDMEKSAFKMVKLIKEFLRIIN